MVSWTPANICTYSFPRTKPLLLLHTDEGSASPKALGTMRRLPPNQPSQPRKLSVGQRPRPDTQNQHRGLFSLPGLAPRSSAESLTAQPSSSSNPSPAHHPGIMHKNLHVSDVLSRARESAGESWDDDFAADISLSKLGREWHSFHWDGDCPLMGR
jgi:hypothetical protein